MNQRLMKFAVAMFVFITIAAGGAAAYLGTKSINIVPRVNLDASRLTSASTSTQNQLTDFADNFQWIAGVNLVKVDFRNNTRSTIFRYYKDEPVETSWREFAATKKSVPLFSATESTNQRLVDLINGQFTCVKTTETMPGILIPIINQFSMTTCMVPIPPTFGDFAGFINIFLRQPPTAEQIFSLEQLSVVMSRDIYKRDVER